MIIASWLTEWYVFAPWWQQVAFVFVLALPAVWLAVRTRVPCPRWGSPARKAELQRRVDYGEMLGDSENDELHS